MKPAILAKRLTPLLPVLQCPKCGAAFALTEQSLICESGHCYDLSRRGYVNLAPDHRQTGDKYDEALFESRGRVFAGGFYAPVRDALCALLDGRSESFTLVDAGCGEGYYLNTLLSAHPDWQGAGVDISREAIERATDWPCEALWCVADLGSLPFLDDSFTAVLDVLTPANYDEFRRVLSPDGMLVKVYPGQDYLREIRAARGMSAYEEGQVDAYLREKAQLVKSVRVHETLPVSPELWGDFVRMTPLNHDLSAAEKDALAQRADAHVTVDLHVALCRFR